jgi:hypothetical protein
MFSRCAINETQSDRHVGRDKQTARFTESKCIVKSLVKLTITPRRNIWLLCVVRHCYVFCYNHGNRDVPLQSTVRGTKCDFWWHSNEMGRWNSSKRRQNQFRYNYRCGRYKYYCSEMHANCRYKLNLGNIRVMTNGLQPSFLISLVCNATWNLDVISLSGKNMIMKTTLDYFWFATFAVFWTPYAFLWAILRRL